MKKAFCVILMLFYIGIASGVSLHFNYCKGRLTSVGIWHDAGCPECSKKKTCCGSCRCCEKVVEFVKLDIDQIGGAQPADIPTITISNVPAPFDICCTATPILNKNTITERYTPPPETRKVYIDVCCFLI